MAPPCREATTATADSSTAAFLAASVAAMGTMDTPERIPGVTGREPRGRPTTGVVLAGVVLEEIGLVIPSLDQPGNHGGITVGYAVNPLIELTRHLVEVSIV